MNRNGRKHWRSVLLLLIIVMVLMLASCYVGEVDSTNGSETTVIRLHYADSYTNAVPQLLMLRGSLEQLLPEGVSIEWIHIVSSQNIRDALATGQIDIGTFSAPGVIAALENGFPLSIVCNSIVQSCFIYSANPSIQSLDDIEPTSKIATQSIGGTYHLALMIASVDLYGDARKFDMNMLNMSSTDAFTSIQSSDTLDALIAGFPYSIIAEDTYGLSPIFDLTPIMKENSINSLTVANKDFYNNNPQLVEIVGQAFQETMDFMHGRPAEAARILAEFYGDIDADAIEEQIRSAPPRFEISESAYDKVAEIMYEVGMITNPPKKFAELNNYLDIPRIP